MLGEAACLADTRPEHTTRVARLSNVYGPDYLSDNFLSSILRNAVRGHVVLHTSRASEKDYVGIEEVVALLPRIAASGRERVYNIASGVNTRNGALLDELTRLTRCVVEVAEGAPTTTFPMISADRIRREFDFTQLPVLTALAGLVTAFRGQRQLWERP